MRALQAATSIATLALWAGLALGQQQRQQHKPHHGQPAPATQQVRHTAPSQASQPTALPPVSQSWPQAQSSAATQQPSQAVTLPPVSQSSPQAQLSALAGPMRYSADALYNLANSYARAGKPGLAVLNYERAALLSPNDPDINANLDYVRATANVPAAPRTRFARVAQVVDPTSAAWLGVLGIGLLGTGLVTNKATHHYRNLRIASVVVGVGLISLAVSNAVLIWPRMHEAVVLVNQTPVRVSPVPMGDTTFVLREAETLTIAARHDDFVLIRTRTGRTGWVARASVGAVVP